MVKSLEPTDMELDVGLRGIAGRFSFRYQAKMRWPNFDGFEEAPATANCLAVKNFAAAACMPVVRDEDMGEA